MQQGQEKSERWAARGRAARRRLPLLLMAAGLLLLLYVGANYGFMYAEQRRLNAEWGKQEAIRRSAASQAQTAAPVDDGLVRLSIPKLELDAVVVEGTTDRDLMRGPGRIKTTAIPGEAGNSVITAHRDTFFRELDALRNGDSVLVRRGGEVFRFEVTGKRVVFPDETSVLRPTKHPQLTLITCYPTYYIGPAPERLVVFSRLVERAPDNGSVAAARE
jgi:sortase A